jgi:hypothetical protein
MFDGCARYEALVSFGDTFDALDFVQPSRCGHHGDVAKGRNPAIDRKEAAAADRARRWTPVRRKVWGPPVSMMAIAGFTHTQAPLTPPSAPYSTNENWVLSPVSGFWGGAVTDHIGAFAQVTYNAPGPGGFADPFGHTWTWDNTDVRYADETMIGNVSVIYGITAKQ